MNMSFESAHNTSIDSPAGLHFVGTPMQSRLEMNSSVNNAIRAVSILQNNVTPSNFENDSMKNNAKIPYGRSSLNNGNTINYTNSTINSSSIV